METTGGNTENCVRKDLYRSSKKGEWERVVEIYKNNPTAHNMKINDDGDTALHMAVRARRTDVAGNLVYILMSTDCEKAHESLRVTNHEGNTPLHLAASRGKSKICRLIAMLDPLLISARNYDDETPFFLAVLHDKTKAFLCLHDICGHDQGLSYCRGRDGQTILHLAISKEFFGLAFQMIHLYKELVNYVNDEGMSPLHLLACKPSAFKSGSNLTGYQEVIYRRLSVDKITAVEYLSNYGRPKILTLDTFDLDRHILLESQEDINYVRYPKNYETCINFFWLLKNATERAVMKLRNESAKNQSEGDIENQPGKINRARGYQSIPGNYHTCFEFLKLVLKTIFIFLCCVGYTFYFVIYFPSAVVLGFPIMIAIIGLGFLLKIVMLHEKKKKHTHSIQIFEELLLYTEYEDEYKGRNPSPTPSTADDEALQQQNTKLGKDGEGETLILIAAKNGITEVLEKILEKFPAAVHDKNSDGKNIVLLAVENKQKHVYEFLLQKRFYIYMKSVFGKVDNNKNSVLHIAAKLGEEYDPLPVPKAALLMQQEIKWFEFIKSSKPSRFFAKYNNEGKTAEEIFTETHKELLKNAGKWMTTTSQACSVVAGLFVTVTYSTAATVPGGLKQNGGTPFFEQHLDFKIFAVSSYFALLFSVIAVVMFLAILTFGYKAEDFKGALRWKMLIGLTMLYLSLAATLISFCAGHFFVLKDWLKFAAFPIYIVTCLLVILFAISQFPLFFQLQWATLKTIVQQGYNRSFFFL